MSTAASITALAIVVLLLVSAYFSATETALDAASRRRIHKLSRDGNRRAQCVERLQKNAERLAGAILLGDTLEEVIGLSSRILVMRDGAITARLEAPPGGKPQQVELLRHMV